MSKMYYTFQITELFMDDNQNTVSEIQNNLPHFEQIKTWLPKEWDKCQIHTTFDGILKDKVQSTSMFIYQDTTDHTTKARITIEFIPGFRLNIKRRQACVDQMDGQMCDGFGESFTYHTIPYVDEHYRITII